MADSDLTCPRWCAQPSRAVRADEAGATGEDVGADPAPCRARHPWVRHKESVIQDGVVVIGRPLSGLRRKYVAPRVVTGGCLGRTQEATRSSAARADEDDVRRRPGPLECDRIYGGEHLASQPLGPADNLQDLLCDLSLAGAVHLEGKILNQLSSVIGGVAHRGHPRPVLGRRRLQ